MKQSNNKKIYTEVAFLYERLSRDDKIEGESYSIENQKKLLTKAAKEKGYKKLVHFCDDGVSGVTMNRPQFNEMMEQLKIGKAGAVFVKDLSRLGRNYLEVGKLLEEFFPENNIRFVAVSDAIDSDKGEDELAPIRNLFNEWYAKDISKKRRISNKVKGSSGIPLGRPPYGYVCSEDNKDVWIVDEEAARVVRRIDTLTLAGYGPSQIATILTEDKILTPVAYSISKGQKKPSNHRNFDPYSWASSTVIKILNKQEYCGDLINFKTYSISYKKKERLKNDPENMMVFKDVHEAIRDRATFETIQEMRGKIRRKPMHNGEHNMFSGLLVCADCGSTMHYHFNQKNPEIQYFSCSEYNKGKLKKCTSSHYIRIDFLEQVVMSEIRRLTRFACKHEAEFIKTVTAYSKKILECNSRICHEELQSLETRNKELDGLFEHIYEDNITGKITDERFAKLSAKYEEEQTSIAGRINQLKRSYDITTEKLSDAKSFTDAVKKYTRAKKLTPLMLNELVEKIEVHQMQIVTGHRIQRVVIHYNCVGAIAIPDQVAIPIDRVALSPRQGVEISYVPERVV